jgi:uncharacterized glyoxalase superfamily protein PhnB
LTYPVIFPSVRYDDAQAAIEFLVRAFGGQRHAVYAGEDGTVHHAEVAFGNGIVMLGSARPEAPASRGAGAGIYVVVEDPDAHCERASGAGAEISHDPHDTDYGSRDYSARDPEGNLWNFGTYQPFDHPTQTE